LGAVQFSVDGIHDVTDRRDVGRFHTRCLHAQARCSAEEPKLREAAPGHRVACHFFETLPIPTIIARAGLANGKFAERLAAFEAAKLTRTPA
jgi:oligopeptide transport system ATP-binding protein